MAYSRRWLAKQLHGFETAAPKQLYRKFVENQWHNRDRAGANRGAL
jgi:hypothetical protein